MSVALELRKAAVSAGLSAVFVPTGQTGMMIDGWGVSVDRVISDFLDGTCEWLVEQAETMGDWIFVEGQGSIDHPAYSAVTLGLIHGCAPHAMVMVHQPGRTHHHGWEDTRYALRPMSELIPLHEQLAGLMAPSVVAAVALNTSLLDEGAARREIARTADELGLPCDDPVPVRRRAAPRRPPRASRMRVATEVLELAFRDPFRIARELPDHGATSVVGTITDDDGATGIGEGYPDPYYGETPATVEAVVPVLVDAVSELGAMPEGLEAMRAWLVGASLVMDEALSHNGAAKCLVDIALHDLAGKRLGLALPELLGTPRELPPTDFTIGIDEPGVVAQRACTRRHSRRSRSSSGGPADLETLEAVRGVYGGPIRVDANTGWTPEVAEALLPECVRLGVELIEQPFPARRLDQLGWLQERSPLPIVADESAVRRGRPRAIWSASSRASTSSWPRSAAWARRCA